MPQSRPTPPKATPEAEIREIIGSLTNSKQEISTLRDNLRIDVSSGMKWTPDNIAKFRKFADDIADIVAKGF